MKIKSTECKKQKNALKKEKERERARESFEGKKNL